MANPSDKKEKEFKVEIEVPDGVELTEEEIRSVSSHFDNSVIDTLGPNQVAMAKVIAKAKTEEVTPKTIVNAKVKN
jgi:hypothetical protein